MGTDALDEHYATLEVSAGCTDQELKSAYRDLAKVWHPDRFAHETERLRLRAQDRLKLINHAYDTLRRHRRDTHSNEPYAPDTPPPPSSESSRPFTSEQKNDVVFCTNCGVSLRVPEGATYLRCPSCKHEQDRNGAPRPQRPPAPPDDSTVEETNETEMPLATPSPNPFPIPLVVILACIAFLVVLSIVRNRVESTKSVEQVVNPFEIESLLEFAGAGNASAQNTLGRMYHSGLDVPQDYAQGVAWYRKAAEQGLAGAQLNLGNAYADGRGVPQDYAQGVAWYRKAAEQGLAEAQLNLGVAYGKGRGVPQDYVESYKWYNLAASRASAENADSASFWSLKNDRLSMYLTPTQIEAAEAVQKLVSPITAEKQKQYAEARDAMAKLMTPAQLAKAQKLAREWLAAFEKRGGK